jgi:hypothetical protein
MQYTRDTRASIGSEIDSDHYLVERKFQIRWGFTCHVAIKSSKLVQCKHVMKICLLEAQSIRILHYNVKMKPNTHNVEEIG